MMVRTTNKNPKDHGKEMTIRLLRASVRSRCMCFVTVHCIVVPSK